MGKHQIVLSIGWYLHRKVTIGIRYSSDAILFKTYTNVFNLFASFIDNRTFEGNLSLPRHCDEGEKDGDDGLLVHNYFVFYVQSYVYYLVCTRKRRKKRKRGCCMIFEAKMLLIREINENRQRKKWLRGTG